MPRVIQDINRRQHIELTAEQYDAVKLYVTGLGNAGVVAKSLGMNRQRFVNLVFNLLPQWYAAGRIDIDGQFTDVPATLRGYGFKKVEEKDNGKAE